MISYQIVIEAIPNVLKQKGQSNRREFSYQVVEYALIQFPFLWSALPELLIIVVETSPVFPKFLETVLVYVFNSVHPKHVSKSSLRFPVLFFYPKMFVVVPRGPSDQNLNTLERNSIVFLLPKPVVGPISYA